MTAGDNILNAMEQGIFNSSTKKRLDDLEHRKEEIEIQIAEENIKKPMLTKYQIVFWFYRLRKTDVTNATHRKRLVDSFVNAIIVHDDRLEFYFNYKDGATTLSVKDLENSSDLVNSLPPKTVFFKAVLFYAKMPESSLFMRTFGRFSYNLKST